MTRNTLGDLHNILFEQMERLNDCDPGSDEMKGEIERSRAMADVGKTMIDNAGLIMKAARLTSQAEMPRMLTDGEA